MVMLSFIVKDFTSVLVDMDVIHKCPEFSLVMPCQCKERRSGLDITCENVETSQLQSVTDNMKNFMKKQDFTVICC